MGCLKLTYNEAETLLKVVYRNPENIKNQNSNYYPFGLTMQAISGKANSTIVENKFKYNGKELQHNEFSDVSGLEEYDFGARMQDPQLGRFFSQDRFAEKYFSLNPYHYTANNPINYLDENGDYITIDKKDDNGNVMLSLLYEGGKAYFYSKDKDGNIVKGDEWDGKDNFISQSISDLYDISSTKQGNTVVSDLVGSKYGYNISGASSLFTTGFEGKDGTRGGGDIYYYQKGGVADGVKFNSKIMLGHELYHCVGF